MDNIDRTETENEETGRWKNFNSWVKCKFNYECYMTFLNGCYSCKWEAQQKKARRPLCCCSVVQEMGGGDGSHFLLPREKCYNYVCVYAYMHHV